MKTKKILSVALFFSVFGATSFAQKKVMVGGQQCILLKIFCAVNSKTIL
jgi:hypothetical protein